MELRDAIRKRRSVRKFDPDKPVAPEVVDRILDHAVRAPSAGFSQGWGFLVLTDPADRERFWRVATPEDGDVWSKWLVSMRSAQLIVVPHSNKSVYLDRYARPDKGWDDRDESRWPVPYWDIDTGFASMLMLLTAVDEGLGACFFGIPPSQTSGYRAEFGVPEEFNPIGAIAFGYRVPDEIVGSGRRLTRRPTGEVVRRGHWS